MNLFEVFHSGDSILVSVFFLLIAMSIASWYLIILKSLNIKTEFKAYNEFSTKYANIKDWPLKTTPKDSKYSVKFLIDEIAKIEPILKNYQDHNAKKEIITMHLIQVLDKIRTNLDKGLTILASIGSSAPFIGLFGTVWGIYNALSNIATQNSAGLNVVAGPMGEALVATAIGLFAAIPAVLAYNSFVRLNKLLVQNLRHIAEQLSVYLSN